MDFTNALPSIIRVGRGGFSLMNLRPEMRAIVALVTAYAVALQAIFLAIGGLVATPDLAVSLEARLGLNSLCLSSRSGAEHPVPGRHEQSCPAACAACCCGAPAVPASVASTANEDIPAGLIARADVIVATWRFDAGHAHRSRAPPLS
jgi:hypothetical protein